MRLRSRSTDCVTVTARSRRRPILSLATTPPPHLHPLAPARGTKESSASKPKAPPHTSAARPPTVAPSYPVIKPTRDIAQRQQPLAARTGRAIRLPYNKIPPPSTQVDHRQLASPPS